MNPQLALYSLVFSDGGLTASELSERREFSEDACRSALNGLVYEGLARRRRNKSGEPWEYEVEPPQERDER